MNKKYDSLLINFISISALLYTLVFSCPAMALDENIADLLVNAIESENVEIIDEIIDENNIKELENILILDTPIIFYAATCYPNSLRRLIELGFDINKLHLGSNLRPVSLSAISDGMECYEILKNEGALKSLRFKEQYELINSAIIMRNQTVVDDLISVGFNYLDDRFGISSIEYAIYNDRSYLFIPHIQDKY